VNVKFLDIKKINASYGKPLQDAIMSTIDNGWFVHGKSYNDFISEFSDFNGVRHCIGVGNGLDALSLVLMAWKSLYSWDDNSEVIVPANTFIATILAISRAGLKPVFCDVRDDNGLMDVDDAESKIASSTKVLLPVHLYGNICDMNRINDLAFKNGLKVLEDACQSHGALYKGKRAGSLGHAAAFSFYPGKNLGALGDGGAVTTDDDNLYMLIEKMSNYGQSSKYVHEVKGVNSRLDDVQAAVLSVKLKTLDEYNDRRKAIGKMYSERIKNPNVRVYPQYDCDSNVFHIYPLRCKNRDMVQARLAMKGIQTLIHYPCPPHKQKAYKEFSDAVLPNSEKWANEELSLPISPVMTDEEVGYVIDSINDL